MKNEIQLNKLLCPKGHDTLAMEKTPDGQPYAWCASCNCGYPLEELQSLPLDRTGLTPLDRPSVYGKPN
jgi:hypothetical protein